MISLPVCTLICVRVSGRANWVPACVRTRVSENLSPRQSVLIVSSRSEFVSVVIWLCQRKEQPFVVPHTTASNTIESNFNYLILLNRWTFIKDNFCEISTSKYKSVYKNYSYPWKCTNCSNEILLSKKLKLQNHEGEYYRCFLCAGKHCASTKLGAQEKFVDVHINASRRTNAK